MTIWYIWGIALVIKTIVLPFVPITPDEAYYFVWARHLQLSYFDNTPMIAWIMTLAIPLWKTPLGIRLPGMIVGHLSLIPWIFIFRQLKISDTLQKFWMVAALVAPLTGLGGLIIVPDIPLLLFWGWSLWAFMKAVDRNRLGDWALLGIFCGLGMLSKYTMVLFLPSVAIYLWWEGKLSLLKKPGPWLTAILTIIFFTPVIIWNAQNHFASFAFQTDHGLGGHGLQLDTMFEYLGGQIALLNPFFAVAAGYFLWNYSRRYKILTVFAVLPFIFFFFTSLRAHVEGNWPAAGYPAMIMLAICASENQRWSKLNKIGTAISGVFIVAVISHTIHPWLPLPARFDHTAITREWMADVEALKNTSPLYGRSYQVAAFHSYYRDADKEVFKLFGVSRRDFYDFLPESHPKTKGFLITEQYDKLPAPTRDYYDISNPRQLPSGSLYLRDLAPK